MVIEKKVTTGDVVSFRIVTGEEIIAKVVDINEKTLTVTKPILAQIQMTGDGRAGIAFGPFMGTVSEDSKFRFNMSNILAEPMKSRDDVMKQYVKMTSGIEVVSASGLIK